MGELLHPENRLNMTSQMKIVRFKAEQMNKVLEYQFVSAA
jgi:hypothetical protein